MPNKSSTEIEVKPCEHCMKIKNLSGFQAHYNAFMDAGADHAIYCVTNDFSEETGNELRRNYEATHPPVPQAKKDAWKRQWRQESDELALQDDIAWLTGTGRFAQ